MLNSNLVAYSSEVTNPPTPPDDLGPSPATSPSAVLLVARDYSLDESRRSTLSDAGIEVVMSVSNNTRALELLGIGNLFDAVVIGVGPGDEEAIKLAQHIRRHRSDTPTFVVSPVRNLEIPHAISARDAFGGICGTNGTDLVRSTLRDAIAQRRCARLRRPP